MIVLNSDQHLEIFKKCNKPIAFFQKMIYNNKCVFITTIYTYTIHSLFYFFNV